MKSFICFVGLFVVFQQALAANFVISLDGNITQIPVPNIIQLPQVDAVTSCSSNCTTMISTIQNCGSTTDDAACYCTNSLQLAMQSCEQCMLNFLVAKNIKPPSNIVGSNPALAGLLASCTLANITLPAVALALPPNWTGPVGIGLNLGATVVVVGTGAMMGMAAVYILFNIS